MDLRTLSYFVTVCEELNITKAAERLNMSQPPLSSQIKNLEEELNTILFIRGKRHLKLTESGELLYRRALEILSLSAKAREEVISMSNGMTGTVSIGLVEGLAPSLVAEWIKEFSQLYPEVRFKIVGGNGDELISKLRSGIINLAVVDGPCDQTLLDSFYLASENWAAFINKDHPLAKVSADTISMHDLKHETLIIPSKEIVLKTAKKWFDAIGVEPHFICTMDSYLNAVALAAKGVGISLFPRTDFIPNDSIVIKNIAGTDKYNDYYFVWRKDYPHTNVEDTFIDFVKEHSNIK